VQAAVPAVEGDAHELGGGVGVPHGAPERRGDPLPKRRRQQLRPGEHEGGGDPETLVFLFPGKHGQCGGVAAQHGGPEFVQRLYQRGERLHQRERPVEPVESGMQHPDERVHDRAGEMPPGRDDGRGPHAVPQESRQRTGGRKGGDAPREQKGLVHGHRFPVLEQGGRRPGRPRGREGDVPVKVQPPEHGGIREERIDRFPANRPVGRPGVEIRG